MQPAPLCSAVIKWRLVQGGSPHSPQDNWDRPQQPPQRFAGEAVIENGWMEITQQCFHLNTGPIWPSVAPLFISVDRNSVESLFLIVYGNTVFFAAIAVTVLLHDYHLKRSSSINSTVFNHYCYYIYLLFIVVVSASLLVREQYIFNIIFFSIL